MIKTAFFFLFTLSTIISAQEKNTLYKYWLNVGIGGSQPEADRLSLVREGYVVNDALRYHVVN